MNLARAETCFVVPHDPKLTDKVGGQPHLVEPKEKPKAEAEALPSAGPTSMPGVGDLGGMSFLDGPGAESGTEECAAEVVFVNPYNTKEVVANKEADVRLVQFYLNILMVDHPPLSENGIYSTDMFQRIKLAQKRLHTKEDGILSKDGTTFKRLVAAFEPKKLKQAAYPYGSEKIDGLYKPFAYYGIWRFQWSPSKNDVIPKDAKLMLHVSREPLSWSAGEHAKAVVEQAIDVSQMPKDDLLHKAKNKSSTKKAFETETLKVLRRVRALDGWNKTLRVQLLQVDLKDRYMWVSESIQFRCPVEPVAEDLTPSQLGENQSRGTAVSYITENGTWAGRILQEIEADICYFKRGRYLESELDKRGFDCICYAGSLYEIQSPHNGIAAYSSSAQMAQACGATAVNWEGGVNDSKKIVNGVAANGSHIKAYFEHTGDQRTMLLWKGSHVCIVDDGETHEFSQSHGGYRNYDDVDDWIDAMGSSHTFHLHVLPAGKQF